MTQAKQTLELRLKRTADAMRRCGPECDIDFCHIVAVEDAAREIVTLTQDNAAWKEAINDELAETFKLIDALGVREEIESGTPAMKAMLAKIEKLKGTP